MKSPSNFFPISCANLDLPQPPNAVNITPCLLFKILSILLIISVLPINLFSNPENKVELIVR